MDSILVPTVATVHGIPTLETLRLRLRPLQPTDHDAYAAMYADPEVTRYLSDSGTWDRGRSWRHLSFLIGHWPMAGFGMWAIEERGSAAFVGVGGFSQPEGWPGFELAGALVAPAWGKGYAEEAGQAALQFAFRVLRKERVISLIHESNHASVRVAERLGERLEGKVDVYGRELLCFAIRAEDYAGHG